VKKFRAHGFSGEIVTICRAERGPARESIMVKMMTKVRIQEYLDELADKGVLARTGKIKNGQPVYVVHPRVHMLCETNRWTLEEAMDFAKRNPIQ
jgi:hypothetical protein